MPSPSWQWSPHWLFLPLDNQLISARSGVIQFFEESVYVGEQPLEPHAGEFQI